MVKHSRSPKLSCAPILASDSFYHLVLLCHRFQNPRARQNAWARRIDGTIATPDGLCHLSHHAEIPKWRIAMANIQALKNLFHNHAQNKVRVPAGEPTRFVDMEDRVTKVKNKTLICDSIM